MKLLATYGHGYAGGNRFVVQALACFPGGDTRAWGLPPPAREQQGTEFLREMSGGSRPGAPL